ncbi:MAG: fumarylacetoacetate hydrolase family protein, partial [Ilumatobacteraceae bacterium]
LWDRQQVGDRLDVARYLHPKAEPELVYVAAEALGPAPSPQDVVAACAGWALAIEIVDPRFESYDMRFEDNTADNSSASGFAMGPVRTPSELGAGFDPASVEVTFSDGTESRSGVSAAAMGSPAVAVAWLAERLATEGRRVEAGHLVLTGGLTAPFDVVAGRSYDVSSFGLPGVGFES